MKSNIKQKYDERKKEFKTLRIPKYLLATNLPLNKDTYLNLVNFDKIITVNELN